MNNLTQKTIAFIGSLGLFSLLSFPAVATPPCLESNFMAEFPLTEETGPNPVLTIYEGEFLLNEAGEEVPIQFARDLIFADWYKSEISTDLPYFVPAEPLPEGQYEIAVPDEEPRVLFMVTENFAPPEDLQNVELYARLNRRTPGTSGCNTSSYCGSAPYYDDILKVIIKDMDLENHAYLIERDDNGDAILIGGDGPFFDGFPFSDFGAACIKVTPIGSDGQLGTPFDAGCIDAGDRSDDRVRVVHETQGCDANAGNSPPILLTLLALIVGRRRSKSIA